MRSLPFVEQGNGFLPDQWSNTAPRRDNDHVHKTKVKNKMVDYLVQSKVRNYIKSKGLNTGGDALDALDEKIVGLIDAAAGRAKANDRKTLMAKDC